MAPPGGSPFPGRHDRADPGLDRNRRARAEIESDPPLIIPRGPSNAKLALLAAAITFVAITGAILFLRSRRPDDAVASPAPPTNAEPGAAPAGEPAARPSEPIAPPPPKAQAAQEPETRQPERRRRSDASAVGQSAGDEGLDASGARRPAQHPPGRRSAELQRRPRHQVAANESIIEPRDLAPERERRVVVRARSRATASAGGRGAASGAATCARAAAAARGSPHAVVRVGARGAQPPAPSAPPPGFIDSKAVTAVVRAHATEVQGCFDRALMEHSDLHGRLTVRASVDPNGHVLGVTPTAVMQGGGRLQACVVEAFGHWTFPPPSGGVKGTVTYSFSFE